MKLCWDNLERVVYKKGRFFVGHHECFFYRTCKGCGEPFIGGKEAMYCDRHCHRTWSDESRQKASLSQTGRIWSEESRKKISIWSSTVRVVTEEHKEKLRQYTGEKSSQWDGGYASKNIPKYDKCADKLQPYEECRRNEQDPNIMEVKCTYCGKWFIPKNSHVKSRICFLNKGGTKERRFYCSTECKKECPIFRQIKHYKGQTGFNSREVQPELRQLVFERDNWTCQKCGSTKSLHCHHIDPVISNPIESADMDVCVTLCKNCHKWVHMNIDGCGYKELGNCV